MAWRTFLRCKIHRATVTEANVEYVGSISIDEDLMDAAGLAEYEQVHVAGLAGGQRLATYVMRAPRGSGIIAMNGAAALRIVQGEKIIIFAYTLLDEKEAAGFAPRVVLVDENNRVREG
ncbi:MAG: aspartate 1-decarboxylase [Candidatus Sumerlaeota bacterium]|nr:aspartate 1-decarboxylase [Candidatus Sumerlaeota bacterium]